MASEIESIPAESEESLVALTSHFAQVQFRLKQIISAEPDHKEELLRELEQFAFQGCGSHMTYDTAASGENGSTESQCKVRVQLMEKLQTQLDDIEKCAKEAVHGSTKAMTPGAEGQASDTVVEKQRLIIEELRKRFRFQFGDNLEKVSTEEIKVGVDKAVKEVVDPIKTSSAYMGQLQGQIRDLERYITFLQTKKTRLQPRAKRHDSDSEETSSDYSDEEDEEEMFTPYSLKTKRVTFADEVFLQRNKEGGDFEPPVPDYQVSMTQQLDGVNCALDYSRCEWEKTDTFSQSSSGSKKGPDDLHLSLLVMRKTLALMEVLTLCQCGGSLQCLPKYVADGKRKRYHLALQSLEKGVDKIAIITGALAERNISKDSKVSLETDLHESVTMTLADSLRVLLEHGLLAAGHNVSLTAGCLPAWSVWGHGMKDADISADCPAWRVFLYYYKFKNGDRFSLRTDQLLMTSFDLPVGATSAKKTLLSAINKCERMYSTCLHKGPDTKFRALVSEGFNLGHLSDWFRIIASSPSIGDDLYTASAFLVTTGFRPALSNLERLKENPTCEPVTLPHSYYQCVEAFLSS